MSHRPDPDQDYIRVNKILSQQASVGPIPADQVVPWMAAIAIAFFFSYMVFDWGLQGLIAISVWLITSWWLLTGRKSYQFINRFVPLPGKDWINGNTHWIPATDWGSWKRKSQKLKPLTVPTQTGKLEKFMPFQNESNLHCILQLEIGGHSFAVFLNSENEDQWSAVIPFQLTGIHPELYREEVTEQATALSEALQELPVGERLTLMMGGRSQDSQRHSQLENLAHQTQLTPIAVLLRNEQLRLQQLQQQGKRQIWYQYAFCTWTRSAQFQRQRDWFGAIAFWLNSQVRKFTGTEAAYFNEIYTTLAREIYEDGFLRWQLLLETKAQLTLQPLNAEQAWHWLWYRFNDHTPPPIPQQVTVTEQAGELQSHIFIANPQNPKDAITVAIEGIQGHSHCPSFVESREVIALNHTLIAAMVMESPPVGWDSPRNQLRWLWKILSNSFVRDTEAWLEINSKNTEFIKDNLIRLSKQSTSANKLAAKHGSGIDVAATVRQEESFEAQRRLYQGSRPLTTALTFLISRPTLAELNKACALLANSVGTANVIRERNICWRVWLETLPINTLRQLASTALFADRRPTLDTETIAGIMPLTKPKDLDTQGVEFVYAQGGYPLHIDLFENSDRALVTAKSGGGKSILGFAFIKQALAQNIPVVGMDLSNAGDSTFKLITELLGNQGAYINLLETSCNLLEPPDLRGLNSITTTRRIKLWKDFVKQAIVAIAMGKIETQELLERVDSLTLRLLEVFFSDPVIIERYNLAFEAGWQSPEWQRMPTLHDLLNFCSKEKLGLQTYEEIDRKAINQIVNQLSAKLVDPNIGDVIGKPSTLSPTPKMKIFALSGLTNENNSYVMSIVAQMACLNVSLASPKSLFVGDELSVLLSRPGFAELIGQIFATGRKEGQSALILAQDIEAIKNCRAASKIFRNLNITITGRTTTDAANAYSEVLNFPKPIIAKNATEAYLPNRTELATHWLIAKDDRYWDCLYYTPPMELAALANSEDEKAARRRILSRYPNTLRGHLAGLKHFSDEYLFALKSGIPIQQIGLGKTASSCALSNRQFQNTLISHS